jgi:hypothetical protein
MFEGRYLRARTSANDCDDAAPAENFMLFKRYFISCVFFLSLPACKLIPTGKKSASAAKSYTAADCLNPDTSKRGSIVEFLNRGEPAPINLSLIKERAVGLYKENMEQFSRYGKPTPELLSKIFEGLVLKELAETDLGPNELEILFKKFGINSDAKSWDMRQLPFGMTNDPVYIYSFVDRSREDTTYAFVQKYFRAHASVARELIAESILRSLPNKYAKPVELVAVAINPSTSGGYIPDGEGVVLMERAEGESVEYILECKPERIPASMGAIGALMAGFHVEGLNPSDEEKFLGVEKWKEMVQKYLKYLSDNEAKIITAIGSDGKSIVDKVRLTFMDAAMMDTQRKLPRGIVHGDLHGGNFMLQLGVEQGTLHLFDYESVVASFDETNYKSKDITRGQASGFMDAGVFLGWFRYRAQMADEHLAYLDNTGRGNSAGVRLDAHAAASIFLDAYVKEMEKSGFNPGAVRKAALVYELYQTMYRLAKGRDEGINAATVDAILTALSGPKP